MERNEFENGWKEAFDGAEATPSENVWSSIESELIVSENREMKRRVLVYQRLAAASVIFALVFAALGIYNWRNATPDKVALTGKIKDPVASVPAESKSSAPKSIVPEQTERANTAAADKHYSKGPVHTAQGEKVAGELDGASLVTVLPDKKNNDETASAQPLVTASLHDSLSTRNELNQHAAVVVQEESPIRIQKKKGESIHLPGTVDQKEKKDDKSEKESEDLWASLALSAGSYNPGSSSKLGYSPAPSMAYSPNGSTAGSTAGAGGNKSSIGSSYSAGIALGMRVAERWVIQSGINYLNTRMSYTSDIISVSSNQAKAFDANYTSQNANSAVTTTSPYQINSTLEFISIPMQAGYLIVDKKLGFQMNAGVATDFFIRNSLQDQSGQVSGFTQGAGSDSPYRSVNWAGLMSTELSYKLARQYRVSIVPGARFLLNSVSKSSPNKSYVMDIGFRFRYILK